MSAELKQNAAHGARASDWKPYPAYKDSGVEWLGKVPEHWDVHLLKRILIQIKDGTHGTYKRISSGYPLLSAKNVFYDGIRIEADESLISESDFKNIVQNGFPKKNDLLLTIVGTIGRCYIYDREEPLAFQRSVAFLRFNQNVIPKYCYFYFQSNEFFQHLKSFVKTSAQSGVYMNDVSETIVIKPSIEEQRAISLYLDDRTRKIASLIEKKQKMIELLKEERAAVINQAVTKGLNPDAPMKDSGIDWLGEVPEHWNIVRLKLISKIKYGLGEPPKQKEDGIPLIRATNIDRGKIIEKDLVLVDPKDVPYERDPVLKKDDIIVVRSGAYTADSAIIPQKYDGAIAGYDMVVRVVKATPKYIAFALLSQYVLKNQLYLQRMRAAQPHLNAEELGDTLILIPPINEEQQAIIQLIEFESAKIDSAISIIEKELLLLQEYRTALISEIVTGKIDVRETT